METFDNFLTGTVTLFSDPLGILIFFGGVIGGMLFGAIPGVSMLTLAAILLPRQGPAAALEPCPRTLALGRVVANLPWVAPTIAAILGMSPPASAQGTVLREVVEPGHRTSVE